ncbi:HesB/IscA family protein [Thiothrix subterranea]|uniref:Iron-sulfur cluster assembly accessory protein n=1 Tax=Thiothrix subterranea TaxID=2735563 RepID=A0AA51MLY5_9GAMM|nr:iron-sulfur cluster assembly accessory protein [Thiothrix subterranea]MDQ5767659.1 iron-sulfur cluster assembly accessory protein [Thiothrix subterranea]QQZ30735.1 iron-sulfur cluster assembly accessory protein [Thiothrix subterranea]WML85466.1 iron-sulfur cluster assembly accessory protein [Thiothrix subterranea]
MITVTAAAATQVRTASVQGNAIGLPLRIAIQTKPDGGFHYLMGFDDQEKAGDQKIESEGVVLVVDEASQPLVTGMTLDYVEIDGKLEFVFINPNDPNYRPPQA